MIKKLSSGINFNYGTLSQRKKSLLIGVLSIVLMYSAVAGIVSVTTPWWLGKGDAPRHIDYVYRVYRGDIPAFFDQFQTPVIKDLAMGVYKDQPAASNPPLFYLLHAPFVGPSLQQGNWIKAIAIGRSINIFIGMLCVIALAWGGYLLNKKEKIKYAVIVAGYGSLMYQFTILNLNYAVDVLFILLVTLNIGFLIKIINHGLRWKYYLPIIILSVLGMATKIPYVVMVAVNSLVFLIAPINSIGLNRTKLHILKKSTVIIIGLISAILISIGWFYYLQNYRATGSILSSAPPDYVKTRVVKDYGRVISGNELWSLLYAGYTPILTLSVVITTFSIAGYFLRFEKSKDKVKIRDLINKNNFLTYSILGLVFIGFFATQVVHAEGTGGYYFRYLLPAVLPISFFLAKGINAFKKANPYIHWILITTMGSMTIYKASSHDKTEYLIPGFSGLLKGGKGIFKASSQNGIPDIIPIMLLLLFILSSITLLISLVSLNTNKSG